MLDQLVLSENKSDIVIIKSFNSLDWLYKLNLAFNYLLMNSITFVDTFNYTSRSLHLSTCLIKLITLINNFCFNLVLVFCKIFFSKKLDLFWIKTPCHLWQKRLLLYKVFEHLLSTPIYPR
jgi:hypothetical protein